MPNDPFVQTQSAQQWKNHHENVVLQISRHIVVSNENPSAASMSGMQKTAARLQTIIAQALTSGVRLRTCGSRWSFSDINVTENCWLVETDQLGYRFFLKAADMDPASTLTADQLILAQCGTKISVLNKDLESKNRAQALRTSGASNGQTIAGAIGTGVHGSSIDVGAMESQVAGIQLLSAGRNLWIERASEPVIAQSLANKLGATLVRNDLLFSAAITNLGALGIVHAVLMKSTGRYMLNSSLQHIPYQQLRGAMSSLDFQGAGLAQGARRPYFFQTIIDPARPGTVYANVRYKEACPSDFVPDYALASGHEPGTDVPSLIGKAISAFPGLRNDAVSLIMKQELRVRADIPKEWKTAGQTFSHTSARLGVASSGFAVPVAQVSRALEIAREAFLEHPSAPIVHTCRYAQKSPGILSFVRYDPTCVIDIDGIDIKATRDLIKKTAVKFDTAGMPYTMHWGKMNSLTNAQVRRAYGGDIDRWNLARRQLLPEQGERNMFSTPFLDGIGLNA